MSFEFLRDGQLYFEDAANLGTYYRLHVGTDIKFSQTFKQDSIEKKTLHAQTNLFEGSVIHSYNPANFDFTLLMIDEGSTHQHTPLDFLIEYLGNSLRTFNLYFLNEATSPAIQYKIENCVFTSGTFNIPRAGFLTVSLSGQGTKLSRSAGTFSLTDPGYTESYALDFGVTREVLVSVDGNTLAGILSISLELTNDISWVEKATIHATQDAVDAGTSIYPSNFTFNGRSLGGSIQQYVDESRAQSKNNWLTWQENIPIRIRAGLTASNLQLDVNMTGCSFTNRPNFGELMTQNYDFRLMTNPADLSSFFVY